MHWILQSASQATATYEYEDCQAAIKEAMLKKADRLEKEAAQLREQAMHIQTREDCD
jgi:hypothetical protein